MENNKEAFNIATHKELWEHQAVIAKSFYDSEVMPAYIKNAASVLLVLEAGHEMGFRFVEALKYLYIVNNVMALSGQGAIRKLRDAGWTIAYDDKPNICTVTITKGEETYSETVTFADAEKSKYTSSWDKDKKERVLKAGWYEGQNRKLKLRYLAVSTVVKTYVPEILGAATDIKEVAEDWEVEEAEVPQKGSDVSEFLSKQTKVGKNKKKESKEVVEPEDATFTEKVDAAEEAFTVVEENAEELQAEDNAEVDPELVTKRKEFFAILNEAGVDSGEGLLKIKQKYGVKSFKDIKLAQLSVYVGALRRTLQERNDIEENKQMVEQAFPDETKEEVNE